MTMNNFPSELNRATNQGLEGPSTEVSIIDAVCVNCNKRFKSMRAVTMHIRMTAARHTVDFISYGKYDKRTGLKAYRESISCPIINSIFINLLNEM